MWDAQRPDRTEKLHMAEGRTRGRSRILLKPDPLRLLSIARRHLAPDGPRGRPESCLQGIDFLAASMETVMTDPHKDKPWEYSLTSWRPDTPDRPAHEC